MVVNTRRREELLDKLDETITNVAACFANIAKNKSDGHDTAFAVLARIVFWHEQYVRIARAIAEGRKPELLTGSFETLNARARIEHRNNSMLSLVFKLKDLQKEFREILMSLPDWSVNFPVKFDSKDMSVEDRLIEIESVISMHQKHFEACKDA
jgi:hypothetical protein